MQSIYVPFAVIIFLEHNYNQDSRNSKLFYADLVVALLWLEYKLFNSFTITSHFMLKCCTLLPIQTPPYLSALHLSRYAYPPPDGNILTNIVNALIAVPRFYTQVYKDFHPTLCIHFYYLQGMLLCLFFFAAYAARADAS